MGILVHNTPTLCYKICKLFLKSFYNWKSFESTKVRVIRHDCSKSHQEWIFFSFFSSQSSEVTFKLNFQTVPANAFRHSHFQSFWWTGRYLPIGRLQPIHLRFHLRNTVKLLLSDAWCVFKIVLWVGETCSEDSAEEHRDSQCFEDTICVST